MSLAPPSCWAADHTGRAGPADGDAPGRTGRPLPAVRGKPVAFLAGPFAPGGGRHARILGEGTIPAANLLGPLAGMPLAVLVAAMRAGGTYANAHTNDGVAPANTRLGDFPGGEVRSQIRAAGP